MRIQRLDLLRYGRFTDTHLALPASDSDIHILFGPNEAGKSTALSAIEDLLFGIPGNSRYNFLHDYGSMRVGAVLENGGNTLEVRRRKGNKDTLLTADEVPVKGGAGALAPFLAGSDQAFFSRMFSLDHERLRKGGQEILEAKDEVGQMLFSAGAGLSGLRDRLKALTGEADVLWASRRAAHRKYYQALERFDVAEKALRDHTVTASKWQEVKRAYDDAQEAYNVLETQNEDISREQRKLSRIRRVYRDIRKIPARDMMQVHRDDRRNADQRLQACRERIRSAGQELERHRKAHERLAHDEDAIAPKDLADAREVRDSGWSLVRRRYVEGVSVPNDEIQAFTGAADLTNTYETAVKTADTLADRRFDNAQAAAQITLTARQIAEQEELLEGLQEEETVVAEECRTLESAWKEMWAEASFKPLAPDLMLEWLASRKEILEAIGLREAADRQLQALRDEESKTTARILAELAAVTAKPSALDGQPIRVVMEAATAVQSQSEKDATIRRQSEERLRKMKADAVRKGTALETAEKALRVWRTEWTAAIELLGLAADTQPEAATAQLDAIDQMREIAVKIQQLRHERIEKIERDVEVFAQDVATLVSVVATDLAKLSPEDAVLELERRLEAAKQIREQQKTRDTAISALKMKIEECNESGREARETIQHLQEAAAAKNIDQLKAAIRNSDKLRELVSQRALVMGVLAKEGDGLALADLSTECEAVDIDRVSSREQTLEQDLKDLRGRITEAAEHRTQTRGAFDAIGGDDRAAEAAAARQAALAELREVAEQYVRVRSSATMLQWAIERFRREKQAPLLKRAGQIFATLTGGSFGDLRVEIDENDNAQLAGFRPDGELVRVGGMSTGTADQLYMALRVASVEDYLDRADALPFVADDLFINFDDARAAAGFEVLAQLARKTQILFFTHHQHLVEIAEHTLGKLVNVVALPDLQKSAA